ncbi:zinc ribbon domain-containing protein [Rouxiella sp. Mn2063]|uniref:zinc ribbon domain-containing protein n=1 Tax=Rouxiella sp. Mn2063 TaxID=3395262 RepID=UPI003BC94F98
MEALCPQCHKAMDYQAEHYHCQPCNSDYQQQAQCPQCQQPLQILKACGAVDYFCQHGHGLISKKSVQFSYQPV